MLIPTPLGLESHDRAFAVDPRRPHDVAVITHAHADHARAGSGQYFATPETAQILRRRIGADIDVRPVEYGERIEVGASAVSFHPAGHCLGSAQVRVEDPSGVTVVSGDYKRDDDPTCRPFEIVECDVFVTEATFALPIFRFPDPSDEARRIAEWIHNNREQGTTSVLLAYALGKAQRLLALVGEASDGPVFTHGAVENLVEVYRELGVSLPETRAVPTGRGEKVSPGAVVIAPPSAVRGPWAKRLDPCEIAFASGWMNLRGTRRRRGIERGFVLSDHADWDALVRTVRETGARRIEVTHGYTDAFARYLREVEGLDAVELGGGDRDAERRNGEAAENG